MKKILSAFLLVAGFAIIIILIVGNSSYFSSRTFNLEEEKVNKITIMDGNTGNQKAITDKEAIKNIINIINTNNFTNKKTSDTDGWAYEIGVMQNDTTVNFSILSENIVRVDGMLYTSSEDLYTVAKEYFNNDFNN